MKKRIAVFANAWSDEFSQIVLNSICESVKDLNIDIYTFVHYSAVDEEKLENYGEAYINNLPDLKEFDGAVLLSNTYIFQDEIEELRQIVLASGIPAVSLECELRGIDFVGTDNYAGMYDLTKHMVEVHHAKKIMFMGGPADNAENAIRKQAVVDALAEYGISIDPEYDLVGNFSFYGCKGVFHEWRQKHSELPDVIICANDAMATGLIGYCQDRGIRVPEDVAITGFDYIDSARDCIPSVTTVSRGWNSLGERGVMHLLAVLEGKDVPKRELVPSRMEVAESCGCHVRTAVGHKKTLDTENSYNSKMENMAANIHFRDIYRGIRKSTSKEQLCSSLSKAFETNAVLEGGNFFVAVNKGFFDSNQGKNQCYHYKRKMDVVCCMQYGKALEPTTIKTKDLICDPYRNENVSQVYLFAPLHIDDACFGYVCFINKVSIIEKYTLYLWTKYMNQFLEQIRQNVLLEELNRRLTELSITDTLTGVYNRTGYESIAIPYLERCRKEGKHAVMMMADINRMKAINDHFGHLQGDVAICTTAHALRAGIPSDWIIVRYGGDEFLVVGECEEQDDVDEIKDTIIEELELESKRLQIPFRLSISLGAVWMDDNESASVEECFKIADNSMYEMKKQIHETEENA